MSELPDMPQPEPGVPEDARPATLDAAPRATTRRQAAMFCGVAVVAVAAFFLAIDLFSSSRPSAAETTALAAAEACASVSSPLVDMASTLASEPGC